MTQRALAASATLLAALALAAFAGCGPSSDHPPFGFVDSNPDGGSSGGSGGTGGSSGLTGIGSGDGGQAGDPSCPVETQFVYVIDVSGGLRRFDPPKVAFLTIGPITCPGGVYSMAVDRQAFAWVLLQSGQIVRVDTRSGACTPTAFAPNQQGFSTTFGMGFSTNAPGSKDETLFVSSATASTLAQLDIKTLTLHAVGPYDKIQARAEMTGTGDGRLYGAFEGSPYIVAEIEKGTAKILSQAPQNAISYPPNSSNFAFAAWGGDFYLFVGPGATTDIFRYRPSDGSTIKLGTVSFEIVGAGVSTCAPTTPPK
jgi:hypothetical protein